jgi:hypothetical protein
MQVKEEMKTMSLEDALNKLEIRGCCRASLFTDEVVSGARTQFNPEREAGVISDVEARQQELSSETSVSKVWHGHMKRTNLTIRREGNVYHGLNPLTEEVEVTYTAPEGEEVAEWLEVSIPTFASKAFAKTAKRILVPRFVSKLEDYKRADVVARTSDYAVDPAFLEFK